MCVLEDFGRFSQRSQAMAVEKGKKPTHRPSGGQFSELGIGDRNDLISEIGFGIRCVSELPGKFENGKLQR